MRLTCYRGTNTIPRWKDVDSGQFHSSDLQHLFIGVSWLFLHVLIFVLGTENYFPFCQITADLSAIPLIPCQNLAGESYYKIDYDIVLSFGLAELKAQVAWHDAEVRCLL